MVNHYLKAGFVFRPENNSPLFCPGNVIMGQPNSIFKSILNGTFRFTSEQFQPRAPGLPPTFTSGRIAVLRKKLLLAGIDPLSVGMPVIESKPVQFVQPIVTRNPIKQEK